MAHLEHETGEAWRVEFDPAGGFDGMSAAFYVLAGDDRIIATIDIQDYVSVGGNNYIRHPVAEANATLIALAPVLARLLEEAGIPIPTPIAPIAPQA